MSELPVDINELTALAGEYVLGTLDARQALLVEQTMVGSADLAALVAAWEDRFAPLTALAVPESPPPGLWERIAERIASAAAVAARPPQARFSPGRFWQGWAVVASLAAAVFAGIAFIPQPPQQRMMTVLLSDGTQTAWTAQVDRQGGLQLAALPAAATGTRVNTAPADNRVLQMWALAPGATAPVSLGLVPRGSAAVSIAAPAVKPVAGMLIEISLEPPGGSPGALPTGPVLFIGRLSEASSS